MEEGKKEERGGKMGENEVRSKIKGEKKKHEKRTGKL